MKKIKLYSFLFIISFALIFSACNPSKKLLDSGQYSFAVQKSVKKIQRKRDNNKEIAVLIKAFPLANQDDLDKINYLNREGRANRWDDVYALYHRLKNRQKLVRTVTPLKYNGRLVEFDMPDYTDEMIEAKKNAADYYYNQGLDKMKLNKKLEYRRAYSLFLKVKQYNLSEYSDLQSLISESYNKGLTKIAVTVENKSRYRFTQTYAANLIALNYSRKIDDTWKKFSAHPNGVDMNSYDYVAKVLVNRITISAEREKEKDYNQSKKIQDGYEYEYDARGNVKKDSLGNDIKHPKYKTIFAVVTEVTQSKSLTMEGTVQIVKSSTRSVVTSNNYSAKNVFKNVYIRYKGNKNALSEEYRKKQGGKRVDFPSDFKMMDNVVPQIKQQVTYKLIGSKSSIR